MNVSAVRNPMTYNSSAILRLIVNGSFPPQVEGGNPFQNIYEAKRRSRAELTYEELQARLASDWMREGMSKDAAMAEAYGHTSAQTEAYDPFTLFAGGLGAGYRLGNTAASVGERLFRAGVQSAVMTAADIPISGMITPAIEEKYPGLALPANLILSVISGVSIEKGAEKGLIKLLESKGIKNAGAAAAEIKAGLAEKAGNGELGTMLDKAIEARGGAGEKIRPPASDMNAAAPAEGVKAEGSLGELREGESAAQGKISSPQPGKTDRISPRDIARNDIAEFLEREPVGTEKARYNWRNDTEKQHFVESVERFLKLYGDYTDTEPIFGKFGHKIAFAPDPRAYERLNGKDSLIEYAAHASSQKVGSENDRRFDSSKARNLEGIDVIIRDADGFVPEGDRIRYYKNIEEGKNSYGVIVLEMKKKGDTFNIDDDCLRYITQLPNKNKSYIESMIKRATSKNPADEVIPQDKPAGTAFPIGNDNIPEGPKIVKDYDVMALLGLDRDNDDWRGRGWRTAYA